MQTVICQLIFGNNVQWHSHVLDSKRGGHNDCSPFSICVAKMTFSLTIFTCWHCHCLHSFCQTVFQVSRQNEKVSWECIKHVPLPSQLWTCQQSIDGKLSNSSVGILNNKIFDAKLCQIVHWFKVCKCMCCCKNWRAHDKLVSVCKKALLVQCNDRIVLPLLSAKTIESISIQKVSKFSKNDILDKARDDWQVQFLESELWKRRVTRQ